MKIILAQLNYTVGDIEGNCQKIIKAYNKVSDSEGIMVCSELALTGYYPQDLVSDKNLLKQQSMALKKLTELTKEKNCAIVVGYIAKNNKPTGKRLFNALAFLTDGEQIFEYYKRLLPTYNVFDEARHFKPGKNSGVFKYKGYQLGFLICEDAWAETDSLRYAQNPITELKQHGLDLVICINASPNNLNKMKERTAVANYVVKETNAPFVYVNQIGGNDELVFDGGSFIMNKKGQLAYQMSVFEEQVGEVELLSINNMKTDAIKINDGELFLKQTALGIKDYVNKCGFAKVVIGSSGGIDSAVTIAICAQALGGKNVVAITLPSKFSSEGSVSDSKILCENLGVKLLNASISEEFELSVKRFKKMCGEKPSDITQENIQARIRGRILMEYSNHFGALVISTGNKSEMSVGYATLYGDMNGGINPLGDLYKMEVYSLAKYINNHAEKEVIPNSIIIKEPSAELSENQLDSDSLPDYPLLDAILKCYIEGDLLSFEETQKCNDVIEKYAISKVEIEKIHKMVNRAEFKRKQAPPIIRIQKRSFGMGRWLPVAAKY